MPVTSAVWKLSMLKSSKNVWQELQFYTLRPKFISYFLNWSQTGFQNVCASEVLFLSVFYNSCGWNYSYNEKKWGYRLKKTRKSMRHVPETTENIETFLFQCHYWHLLRSLAAFDALQTQDFILLLQSTWFCSCHRWSWKTLPVIKYNLSMSEVVEEAGKVKLSSFLPVSEKWHFLFFKASWMSSDLQISSIRNTS